MMHTDGQWMAKGYDDCQPEKDYRFMKIVLFKTVIMAIEKRSSIIHRLSLAYSIDRVVYNRRFLIDVF